MDFDDSMLHIVGISRGFDLSWRRNRLVQSCNEAAMSTGLVENRSVIMLPSIDPDALMWRAILQSTSLVVYNGFHQEGIGDHPIILVSRSLCCKADWQRNARLVRQHCPGGIICVLGDSGNRCSPESASQIGHWDDARAVLIAAGIDFSTLEDPKDVSDHS